MNSLEWIAAGLGVLNVGLVVRRSVWNYPFGLVMVTLYAIVFYRARLYSDALLQLFFFAIQIYGWWNWSRAQAATGEVGVTRMSNGSRLVWLLATAAVSLCWGLAMARFTDAASPLIDAGIAGTSVAAQILMSLRRIENWLLWIAVDITAILLFWNRGLAATSILYAVFLVMSVIGLLSWLKAEPRSSAA